MKTNFMITTVIFIVALLFVGHLHISIKPFSISLPYWHRSLGILLVVIGMIVFNVGEYVSGYNEAMGKATKIIKKYKEDKNDNSYD